MLRGVLLGTAVETFIPEDTFTHYLGGSSLLGLVAALVVAGLFPAQGPCQGPGSAQDGHRGLGRGQSHPAAGRAAPGEQRRVSDAARARPLVPRPGAHAPLPHAPTGVGVDHAASQERDAYRAPCCHTGGRAEEAPARKMAYPSPSLPRRRRACAVRPIMRAGAATPRSVGPSPALSELLGPSQLPLKAFSRSSHSPALQWEVDDPRTSGRRSSRQVHGQGDDSDLATARAATATALAAELAAVTRAWVRIEAHGPLEATGVGRRWQQPQAM